MEKSPTKMITNYNLLLFLLIIIHAVGNGSRFHSNFCFVLGFQSGYNRFFPSNLRHPVKLALNSPTCLSRGRVDSVEDISCLSSLTAKFEHKSGLSLLSDSVHGFQLNT